eukprot:jgi/Bigna1/127102/aug1.3_g1810
MYAAMTGRLDVVEYFVKHGYKEKSSMNMKLKLRLQEEDTTGRTALDYAALGKHTKVKEYLQQQIHSATDSPTTCKTEMTLNKDVVKRINFEENYELKDDKEEAELNAKKSLIESDTLLSPVRVVGSRPVSSSVAVLALQKATMATEEEEGKSKL